ncbi:MAG: flagellar export chaperone FliS [Planctomycetota bacterium]
MSSNLQAAEAYLSSSVENAPPIKIVRMLYQGALRFIAQAEAEDAQDPRSKYIEHLSSADAIVAELRLALRPQEGAESISDNLGALYLFCETELQRAMIEREKAALPGVTNVLRILLDAWTHVDVEARAA